MQLRQHDKTINQSCYLRYLTDNINDPRCEGLHLVVDNKKNCSERQYNMLVL
jgi:hypothetical protein